MYIPEEGMKETLCAIATESAPGSALLLEYLNRGGLEVLRKYPTGMIKNAFDWGKRSCSACPMEGTGSSSLKWGLELGETLKIGSPESVNRYGMRQDGTYYRAHLEKVFQERREAALKAMDEAGRQQATQAAATSGYWLAELAAPQRRS
jgi:hypothetical protein